MTYSLSRVDADVMGSHKVRVVDMDISSYETGGESLVPSDVGLNRFINVVVQDKTGSGYVPQYDYANGKLQVFEAGADAAPLDEVAAATDLGDTLRLMCFGK